MTREERREKKRLYDKAYSIKNKEKKSIQNKAYREANLKNVVANQKKWRETHKDIFYTLYYLPNHNYIGVTNQLRHRLRHHKAMGRDIRNSVTIKTFKTKREALDVERFYHSIGYEGANKQSKLINPII